MKKQRRVTNQKSLRGGFLCLMAILCPRLTDPKDKAKKETEHSVFNFRKERSTLSDTGLGGKIETFFFFFCLLKRR